VVGGDVVGGAVVGGDVVGGAVVGGDVVGGAVVGSELRPGLHLSATSVANGTLGRQVSRLYGVFRITTR
jgi:hypothetical protein